MDMKKKGAFIAFEGIDGSGKSTQIQILSEKLRELGISFYATMEPTDSPVGSMIHQIMTGRMQADHRVIAALFVADRLDHLLNEVNGVKHQIENGVSVIMDRYCFSSYAYQSIQVPMDWLIQANALSSGILKPDLNIFLDADPDTALERIAKNRFQKELFEERSWLVKVRGRYFEAFDKLKDSEHVIVIDADRSAGQVAEDVWKAVRGYFV